MNSFFAIKKGVLYEYENENSRVAKERKIQIKKISVIDKNPANENELNMLCKNMFYTMEFKDKWLTEKWINSLKFVKENIEEYEEIEVDPFSGQSAKQAEKYVNLNVYTKVTVKSCFKDYDVLCEEFEQK